MYNNLTDKIIFEYTRYEQFTWQVLLLANPLHAQLQVSCQAGHHLLLQQQSAAVEAGMTRPGAQEEAEGAVGEEAAAARVSWGLCLSSMVKADGRGRGAVLHQIFTSMAGSVGTGGVFGLCFQVLHHKAMKKHHNGLHPRLRWAHHAR
jgi:hypothetical protein